jgi:D-lyxose ketol-isomerase
MITQSEVNQIRVEAAAILVRVGIAVTQTEIDRMEVADFGLSEIRQSGAQIVTLVDTPQIAAKLLIMLPFQTEPEHIHPKIDAYAGKEETIRCEGGKLYLYGPGEATVNPQGNPPKHRQSTYTVWHEYVLKPGDQITFPPNTPHWFQGGPEGCVIWSFSTKVIDKEDHFTDPNVQRETIILDE